LVLAGLFGKVDADPDAHALFKSSRIVLRSFALLAALSAARCLGWDPAFAAAFALQVAVRLSLAAKLPSSRSRLLSLYLALSAVLSLIVLWTGKGTVFPSRPEFYVYCGWRSAELIYGLSLTRVAFACHTDNGFDRGRIVLGLFASAGCYLIGDSLLGSVFPGARWAVAEASSALMTIWVILPMLQRQSAPPPPLLPLEALIPLPDSGSAEPSSPPATATPFVAMTGPDIRDLIDPHILDDLDAPPTSAPPPEEALAPLSTVPPAGPVSDPRPPTQRLAPRRPSSVGARPKVLVVNRRRPRVSPLAIACAAAVVGVAGLGLYGMRMKAPATEPASSPEALLVAATSIAPVRTATRAPIGKRLSLDVAIFGGRPLRWWKDELRLAQGARAELLRRRIEAYGFRVSTDPGDIQIAPEIQQRLAERLHGTNPTYQPPPADAERPRQIIQMLEESARSDERFRPSLHHPRVILAERAGLVGCVRIAFAAGAIHDGEMPGLTRVSQMAVLHDENRPLYRSLMLALDKVGGSLVVETGVTDSALTLVAPAPEFDDLAAKLVRAVLVPNVESINMPAAKARAISERNDANTDQAALLLASKAFDDSRYANPPLGRRDVIQILQRSDLKKHFAGPLAPANATVVVTGRFDRARFRSLLRGISGGLDQPTLRPSTPIAGAHPVPSLINMSLVAFPVTLQGPEDVAKLWMSAKLVEEHLFAEFRARGIAYQVSSGPQHHRWLDFLLVTVPFGEEAPDAPEALITREIEALFEDGLDDRTVGRNRRAVLESLAEIDQNPFLLAQALGGAKDVETAGVLVAKAVMSLTTEQLVRFAEDHLQARMALELNFQVGEAHP